MKDIIKYFKLLKYGLQIKAMVILAVIFFGLGIVYELVNFNGEGLIPFSGLYLAISGMYIYQVVITASVSCLVQTSSVKKNLQCSAPVLFTTVCILFTYTVFVILRLNFAKNRALAADPAADTTVFYLHLLSTAALIALILLYFAFSYRYYVISTVALCFVLVPTLVLFMRMDWSFTVAVKDFVSIIIDRFGHGAVIGISYILILAGAGLCYLANLAMYRKPLSHIAYRAALRQAQGK